MSNAHVRVDTMLSAMSQKFVNLKLVHRKFVIRMVLTREPLTHRMTAIFKTGNGESENGNGERGTGNGERGTRNGERGTGNGESLKRGIFKSGNL